MSLEFATPTFPNVKYVFLDRDGVINRKAPEGEYIGDWRDFRFLPGVESAIAALNAAGRRVIIVSNQRGIALGLYTHDDVAKLHQKMRQCLAEHGACIHAIYYCPHDKDECDCRKPKTGLFRQALQDFPEASAQNSIVIGDSFSDMQAAESLGFPAIFIHGPAETQSPHASKALPLAKAVANSLADAVSQFLP